MNLAILCIDWYVVVKILEFPTEIDLPIFSLFVVTADHGQLG